MKDVLDPRQQITLNLYTNPKSDTFGNLYQSALKAGYSTVYSKNLRVERPDWLTDNVRNTTEMIRRAERNLKKYLDIEIDITDKERGNIDLAKLQVDVSKFVAKTLARSKYTESEDQQAPAVNIKVVNYGGGMVDAEVVDDTIIEGK